MNLIYLKYIRPNYILTINAKNALTKATLINICEGFGSKNYSQNIKKKRK